MRSLGESVKVTQEQLRKALIAMLGNSAEVAARNFTEVLPKRYKPIGLEAWKAGAKAEGLEIEAMKPWGLMIRRPGAAKQAVPAIATRGGGAASHHAQRQRDGEGATNGPAHEDVGSNRSQASVVLPGLRGKNAVSVTAPGGGRESCANTEGTGGGNAPLSLPGMQRVAPRTSEVGDAAAVARATQEYQMSEARAKRVITFTDAVAHVTNPPAADDPREMARRLQDKRAAMVASGDRTATLTSAARQFEIENGGK